MVYIFAAAFNAGWGPVAWVYVSEIPSNRLRAYNVALASFTHWVMNLTVSKTTPVMLLSTPYKTYFIFGSINVVMAIAGYWIPETKGVCTLKVSLRNLPPQVLLIMTQISLERMDELFGTADLSNVEDVGVAAQQAKQEQMAVETENVHANKV